MIKKSLHLLSICMGALGLRNWKKLEEMFKVSKWGPNVNFNYSCFYDLVNHLYPKSCTFLPAITHSHSSNSKVYVI